MRNGFAISRGLRLNGNSFPAARRRERKGKRTMKDGENAKETAYRELVKRVSADYRSRKTEDGQLKWCENCREINLWTYWQGRGHFDARILLAGQDWGSPKDEPVMRNVCDMNDGKPAEYMCGNESITDKNLVKLFASIGYAIDRDDPQNRDLFFTNFILGYRESGCSGHFDQKWARRDRPYFKELVEIIEPEVILCMGRAVFTNTLAALGCRLRPGMGSYNAFIESERNPAPVPLDHGKIVHVFALAHCGALGTLNRNRGLPDGKSLERQERDWSRIPAFLG